MKTLAVAYAVDKMYGGVTRKHSLSWAVKLSRNCQMFRGLL